MNTTISPKITALTFGVLAVSFLAAFYVVAWQEPGQAPPAGNVPTPLNVGIAGQSKEGGLILNTSGAPNGLIIDKGKFCIGTDCRDKWPETGIVQAYRMVAASTATTWQQKTYNCPVGTVAIQTYCTSAPYTCGGYARGQGCNCSVSGRTATITAYVGKIIYQCTCESPCCPSFQPSITCSTAGAPCGAVCQPFSCEMEFQCGIKTEVGQ